MRPSQRSGGIEERRDANGRLRYRVRVRRNGGSQTATLPSIEDALAWRAQALAASEGRGEPPEPPRAVRLAPEVPGRVTTVEEAARRLCRGMVSEEVRTRNGRPYKPSVCRKYEEALRTLVLPQIGAVPIASLTHGDCQRLVDELAAGRTPEHGRKALTALRVALRVAERDGEIETNPCAGVQVPASAEGERASRFLTPEESASVIAAALADDERLGRSFAGPLVALLFATGLRLGEALALTWGADGIDLDAGVVRVRQSLDRVRNASGAYPLLSPKSRAARRDVPLPAEDAARMRRHRLATGRPADGSLVFAGPLGEALSPVPATRAFKRACFRARVFTADATPSLLALTSYSEFKRSCAEAKLEQPLPHPHDARHTFATHALAAGLSAHAVAALLGHSDAGLVFRRYGHALPDELAGAGDTLSAWRRSRGVEMAQDWPTTKTATPKTLQTAL
jgi:integrase